MIQGFQNEMKIASSFNGKTYEQLNTFQQQFIADAFGSINLEEKFLSNQLNKIYKPDIFIKTKDKNVNISIKSGRSDSMHFEPIRSFILFLRENGVSIETQKIVLLFHYGDGTLNGHGKTRYNFDHMLIKMADKINKANEELNKPELISKCLYRFVFQGFKEDEPMVDYIYYGDENYGTYAKRDHIIKFVLNKRYEHIKTLHIGPMTIQPYLRDVNFKSGRQYKRESIQVKWHYLLTDLQYVNNMADWKHWK